MFFFLILAKNIFPGKLPEGEEGAAVTYCNTQLPRLEDPSYPFHLLNFENIRSRAGEMAWQVKVPAAKPEDLSFVLGTHTVRGEN